MYSSYLVLRLVITIDNVYEIYLLRMDPIYIMFDVPDVNMKKISNEQKATIQTIVN